MFTRKYYGDIIHNIQFNYIEFYQIICFFSMLTVDTVDKMF